MCVSCSFITIYKSKDSVIPVTCFTIFTFLMIPRLNNFEKRTNCIRQKFLKKKKKENH